MALLPAPHFSSSEFDPKTLLKTSIDNQSIQLISVLGVGAYGVVYLGVHVPTSCRYAVKLLTKSETMKTEIELHSRVSDHPGVLGLEKVIRENGRVFLVLEYASGGDLFSAITQKPGVAGNSYAIRYIFLQILDAVQYCHDNGIAHRDLKPENVLMFPHLTAKLADFGLATTQCVSNEFGCGSSFYFSPECQGQQFVQQHQNIKGYSTRQNDVWSLGIILVNLTVARNPWREAMLKDTAFTAYCKRPHQSFFKKILPTISDALADLFVRIFTLDPARRISLPELRVRVATIKYFFTPSANIMDNTARFGANITTAAAAAAAAAANVVNKCLETTSLRSSAPEIAWTRSLFHSVCDYASGFVEDADEDETEQLILTLRPHPIQPSDHPAPSPLVACIPPTPCFSASPCSSISSADISATPDQQRSIHITSTTFLGIRKIDMGIPISLRYSDSLRYHVF